MDKFEVGDRVRYKDNGNIGTIVGHFHGSERYTVVYDNDKDTYEVAEEWIEHSDIVTAFLKRWHDLLKAFDAEMIAYIGKDDSTKTDKPLLHIEFNGDWIDYEGGLDECAINADNVYSFRTD